MRRFIIYLIIGLGLWFGWEGYTRLTAPGRMTPELTQLLKEGHPVDIIVELGFEPEAIHLRFFQKLGRVVGVDKNRVHMVEIAPSRVQRMARYYWIRKLFVQPAQKVS
jgi:ribosomal protein L21E